MNTPSPVTIRRATASEGDVAQISTLLIANSAENGGMLYGDWTAPMIGKWLETGSPVIVAENAEGIIKGVLFSAENAADAAPPVREMFKVAAEQRLGNPYAYGPICVDASIRGQGMPGQLFALLDAEVGGRRGILFINSNNPGSLQAHRKLGMPLIGGFTLGDQVFDVLATPA